MSGETKLCPVCDSVIDGAARRCPECNTDLSLFDVSPGGPPDEAKDAGEKDGKSIDDILDSIVKGKGVRSDFFEDIKTIATNGSTADEDILADAEAESGVEFECPNCGARVAASAKVCPGCGAEFAEDAVEQFECPLCNAVVDVTATTCPNCGVAFAEDQAVAAAADTSVAPPMPVPAPEVDELGLDEVPLPVTKRGGPSPMERLWKIVESSRAPGDEVVLDRTTLYKDLPRLVNEVKPLLLIAKKVGVEIGDEKDLISEAIAHGKKRDVETAVRLIRQARNHLEYAFTSQLAKRIEGVLVEAERARATGADVGAILRMCGAATDALEGHDYAAAGDQIKAAKEEFDARSGGYSKARQELVGVRELVADAKLLGVSLREVDTYVTRAEAAMNGRNFDQAAGLAVQARQTLSKVLPDALHKEMKKARNALLDLKVKGGDLTKSVGYLKQASIHMKREEYADAVKFVRMFRDELGKPPRT